MLNLLYKDRQTGFITIRMVKMSTDCVAYSLFVVIKVLIYTLLYYNRSTKKLNYGETSYTLSHLLHL